MTMAEPKLLNALKLLLFFLVLSTVTGLAALMIASIQPAMKAAFVVAGATFVACVGALCFVLYVTREKKHV
jgi:hypothetical protein